MNIDNTKIIKIIILIVLILLLIYLLFNIYNYIYKNIYKNENNKFIGGYGHYDIENICNYINENKYLMNKNQLKPKSTNFSCEKSDSIEYDMVTYDGNKYIYGIYDIRQQDKTNLIKLNGNANTLKSYNITTNIEQKSELSLIDLSKYPNAIILIVYKISNSCTSCTDALLLLITNKNAVKITCIQRDNKDNADIKYHVNIRLNKGKQCKMYIITELKQTIPKDTYHSPRIYDLESEKLSTFNLYLCVNDDETDIFKKYIILKQCYNQGKFEKINLEGYETYDIHMSNINKIYYDNNEKPIDICELLDKIIEGRSKDNDNAVIPSYFKYINDYNVGDDNDDNDDNDDINNLSEFNRKVINNILEYSENLQNIEDCKRIISEYEHKRNEIIKQIKKSDKDNITQKIENIVNKQNELYETISKLNNEIQSLTINRNTEKQIHDAKKIEFNKCLKEKEVFDKAQNKKIIIYEITESYLYKNCNNIITIYVGDTDKEDKYLDNETYNTFMDSYILCELKLYLKEVKNPYFTRIEDIIDTTLNFFIYNSNSTINQNGNIFDRYIIQYILAGIIAYSPIASNYLLKYKEKFMTNLIKHFFNINIDNGVLDNISEQIKESVERAENYDKIIDLYKIPGFEKSVELNISKILSSIYAHNTDDFELKMENVSDMICQSEEISNIFKEMTDTVKDKIINIINLIIDCNNNIDTLNDQIREKNKVIDKAKKELSTCTNNYNNLINKQENIPSTEKLIKESKLCDVEINRMTGTQSNIITNNIKLLDSLNCISFKNLSILNNTIINGMPIDDIKIVYPTYLRILFDKFNIESNINKYIRDKKDNMTIKSIKANEVVSIGFLYSYLIINDNKCGLKYKNMNVN